MGLFKPAWMSNNRQKALAAVEKESNQVKLATIAQSASNEEVRRKAVTKLGDQSLLAVIAKGDKAPGVRKAAVDKLKNPSVVADIARADESGDVRCAAVGKLTDQALLIDIFLNDGCTDVRVVALRNIQDDKFVGKRVYYDQESSPRVRACALKRSAPDKTLIQWAAGIDPAYEVRKQAAELLHAKVPTKKNSYGVAQTMAHSNAFSKMMSSVQSAARSGNLTATAYSPRNAANALSNMSMSQPDLQIRIAAARKIAKEAIEYIAREVDLEAKLDLELLSHENALKKEMEIEDDFAGIQPIIASYLMDIGLGRMTGTNFPTQARRLVYLLTNKELLLRIMSLDSRVYEYQTIKAAAEMQYVDCGGQLAGKARRTSADERPRAAQSPPDMEQITEQESKKTLEDARNTASTQEASKHSADTGKTYKEMERTEGVAYIHDLSASGLMDLIQAEEQYEPSDLTWLCSRMVEKLMIENERSHMTRHLVPADNNQNRKVIERALRTFGNEGMVSAYRSVDFLDPREAEKLFTQLMLGYASRSSRK